MIFKPGSYIEQKQKHVLITVGVLKKVTIPITLPKKSLFSFMAAKIAIRSLISKTFFQKKILKNTH